MNRGTVKPIRIILVGFGNIGRALARMILEKRNYLQKKFSMDVIVTGISDINYSIVDKSGKGLDLEDILSLKKPELLSRSNNLSYEELLQKIPSDIIVEMTPSTLDGQPAISFIQKAFQSKKHVVTSNKSPLVFHYHDLIEWARSNNCEFRFKATVGGVIPIFAILHEGLAASEIVKIEGILNGTTNYILTRMSEGTPYAQAIESAKKAGFCETNPSDDLSGLDAARKLVIIANVLMDYNLPLSAVKTRGIEDITQAKILESHLQNQVIKHIASLELTDNGILASVEPKSINISNPLAHVNGIMNAINLTTKEAGEVTLSGVGAGPREVSAVILSDIIAIGMKFK